MIMSLVGVAAQARRSDRLQWRYGSRDFLQAFDLACDRMWKGSLAEVEACLRYCWSRAQEFVKRDKHWLAIQAVAAALLTRESLSALEVRKVISKAFEDSGHQDDGTPRFSVLSEVESLTMDGPDDRKKQDLLLVAYKIRTSLKRQATISDKVILGSNWVGVVA